MYLAEFVWFSLVVLVIAFEVTITTTRNEIKEKII